MLAEATSTVGVDASLISVVIGALVAFGGLAAWLVRVSIVVGKIKFQVEDLWEFKQDLLHMNMRRAASDAVKSGIATMNSPFVLTAEAISWLEPYGEKLREIYHGLDKADDVRLMWEIDKKIGSLLLKEVSVPHQLSQLECLLIAAAVAKSQDAIDLPDDTSSINQPPA